MIWLIVVGFIILSVACLWLDMRLYVLKAKVDLLLSDRNEFFEVWERMKEEETE